MTNSGVIFSKQANVQIMCNFIKMVILVPIVECRRFVLEINYRKPQRKRYFSGHTLQKPYNNRHSRKVMTKKHNTPSTFKRDNISNLCIE